MVLTRPREESRPPEITYLSSGCVLLLNTRAILKKDVGLIEVTKEEQRSRSFGGDWNGRANVFSSGIVVLVTLRSGYNEAKLR